MAGASNLEVRDAFVVETTPGTTPSTPAFKTSSFDQINLTANPRVSESFPRGAFGQRFAVGRNGIAVSGSARGKLIYGEYDDFFASLFQDDWSTNVLVNGQKQIAMTIEQAIPAGAGAASLHYLRFKGVEVVTGRLNLTAGEDATVELDLIGAGSDNAASAILAGATYAPPTETAIIGSGSDIGTITMTGFSLDCMESCVIDFGVSSKEEQPRISSDDACGITRGVMRPVITGRFYVEDEFLDIYNAARNGGADFALTIPIGKVATKKYELHFPACQFVEAPLETGDSGPAFQTFRILPKYHAATGGTVRLTRAIA